MRIRQRQNDHIHQGRDLARGIDLLASLLEEGIYSALLNIISDHGVARREQILGHSTSHQTKPHKSDSFLPHISSLRPISAISNREIQDVFLAFFRLDSFRGKRKEDRLYSRKSPATRLDLLINLESSHRP